MAHIGVIRCLEDCGYEISYVSGSSIGALIGGLYAAGKLDSYTDWVCALQKRDIVRLLNWSFARGAIFSDERIASVLREMVGDQSIDELPIGFTAVATDINARREIWLNRGSLLEAIRASIAVPPIFPPVERDGLLLLDGGIVNPLPIAPTLNDDTSLTIAVNLNARAEQLSKRTPPPRDDTAMLENLRSRIAEFFADLIPRTSEVDPGRPTAFELVLRAMDTMQITIARMKLAAYSPELIIDIPGNLCTFFEFDRAAESIDFGYGRAKEVLEAESASKSL